MPWNMFITAKSVKIGRREGRLHLVKHFLLVFLRVQVGPGLYRGTNGLRF